MAFIASIPVDVSALSPRFLSVTPSWEFGTDDVQARRGDELLWDVQLLVSVSEFGRPTLETMTVTTPIEGSPNQLSEGLVEIAGLQTRHSVAKNGRSVRQFFSADGLRQAQSAARGAAKGGGESA